MKNLTEFYKGLKKACLVFLLPAVMLSMAACATTSTTSSEAPQLMFVQIAEDLKVDPAKSTIRLVKVDQQTLYFFDRPQRIAGQLKMADYLKTWNGWPGQFRRGSPERNPFCLRAGTRRQYACRSQDHQPGCRRHGPRLQLQNHQRYDARERRRDEPVH